MIKIFPCDLIKEIDAYTINNEPITSVDLMERVAHTLVHAISNKWKPSTPIVVFAGPGNNGGDALALARLLAKGGYPVEVFLLNPKGELSADCQHNKDLLMNVSQVKFTEVTSQFAPPELTPNHLVIDGLFGSGLNKPLTGGFAAVVKYINASPAQVVAIDIPSGLMGENNAGNSLNAIIKANYTYSLELPKLAFFFAENSEFVGKWSLLDIGLSKQAIAEQETDYFLLEKSDIAALIKPRHKFAHKGNFGHALLIAGSKGMAGASILASQACLRSGVGLLTVHAPSYNVDVLQTTVPEAIVQPDFHEDCFAYATDTDQYKAVAIGPGLGKSTETEAALFEQIAATTCPMVLDADAINLLSRNKPLLKNLPEGSVFTPHPKELEGIIGGCADSYERLAKACALAHLSNTHIILKGAYTILATPHGQCYINSTGNPGMATAGSGDVLTGILLALLAQEYASEDAAKIAVYVHGLAGDLACKKYGEIALKAGDIIELLPQAWQLLNEN